MKGRTPPRETLPDPGLVQECIHASPCLVRYRDGTFEALGLRPLTVAAFCDRWQLPFVRRPDPLALLCEPFLDTEFTPTDETRTRDALGRLGFSDSEIQSYREALREPMLRYNSQVWEWVHLSWIDVLTAVPDSGAQALAHASTLALCSAVWERACRALPNPPRADTDRDPGPLFAAATGRVPLSKSQMPSGLSWTATRDALASDLTAAYSGRQRHFHTTTHLAEAWELAQDSLRAQGSSSHEDLTALARILAFHDAAYEPGSPDNESLSAQLAESWLRQQEVADSERESIARWILWSAQHDRAQAVTPLGRAFFDADLGVLGLGPTRYAEYAAAIRQEFTSGVPEKQASFNAGRARFLEKLENELLALRSSGTRFYFGLHPLHDTLALENVSRELRELRAALGAPA